MTRYKILFLCGNKSLYSFISVNEHIEYDYDNKLYAKYDSLQKLFNDDLIIKKVVRL